MKPDSTHANKCFVTEEYNSVLIVVKDREEQSTLSSIISLGCPMFDLHMAKDGEEGLLLFKRVRPHIIITDLGLPRLDGLSMAEEIRRIEPSVELIILSCSTDLIQINRALSIGIHCYVPKPIKLPQLYEALSASHLKVKDLSAHGIKDAQHRSGQLQRHDLGPTGLVTGFAECFDSSGAADSAVGTLQDLTETEDMRQALRASEKLLRLACSAANAGAFQWDMHTNRNEWSDELWGLYGLEPNSCEPCYQSWLESVHPEDRATAEQKVHEAVATEGELYAEWRVNGTGERWLLSRARPLRDEHGKVARYIGIVMDITAEKKVQQELLRHRDNLAFLVEERTRELQEKNRALATEVRQRRTVERSLSQSQARFRALFEYSLDAIFLAEAHGVVLAANQAACNLFDMTEEELCRAGRTGLIDPSDDRLDAVCRERDLHGSVRNEFRFKRKDGSVFLAEMTSFLVDKKGKYFVIIRDITASKRAEAEILSLNTTLELRVKERTAELEAAIKEIESFSYSVSHDLRAPLRHINNYSAIIAEELGASLTAEAQHYLGRMAEATSRMGTLIDHLLELTRVGRTAMHCARVDLSALAMSIAAALQAGDEKRQLEVKIEEGLDVEGDPILLRQLLENLFDNAWKYSAKQPITKLEFGRKLPMEPSEACFCLRDNGIGFDMTYSDKLFRIFERLHGAEYAGTGIGLATVKRIMERHGGRVWAEGSVGRGATFYFALPQNTTVA
ncbi:PAS domain S-box protein [Geomonas paludis]|uniref:histidine kinase n=1 Tax=Geomonas paludis TaxID=2740185 RepID=A0ABY4LMU4_9BACT|nr:PAS domain S-box protein [Geomonas paludis]UPU37837.1 PAS domain S-box protein [Geomonas paludis]